MNKQKDGEQTPHVAEVCKRGRPTVYTVPVRKSVDCPKGRLGGGYEPRRIHKQSL